MLLNGTPIFLTTLVVFVRKDKRHQFLDWGHKGHKYSTL
jgi:hypothetical protein